MQQPASRNLSPNQINWKPATVTAQRSQESSQWSVENMRAHAIKMKSSERRHEMMKTPVTSEDKLCEGEDVAERLKKLVQQQHKLANNEVGVSPRLFNLKRGSAS